MMAMNLLIQFSLLIMLFYYPLFQMALSRHKLGL
nr:MAG TPA: hypothetical protein [Caudoviricetes sp.]